MSADLLRRRDLTGSAQAGQVSDDVASGRAEDVRCGETPTRVGNRKRRPTIYPTPTRSSELRQLLHSRDRCHNSTSGATVFSFCIYALVLGSVAVPTLPTVNETGDAAKNIFFREYMYNIHHHRHHRYHSINTKNLKSFITVKAHCSMTHLKRQKSFGFF